MFAEVIVDIKNKQVNRTFDYIIPEALDGICKVGQRCIVPFGKMKRTAYILKIKATTDVNKGLKEIMELIDFTPVLTSELIELGLYMANHYFSFYSQALEAMIPQALRMKYEKIIRKINEPTNPLVSEIFKRRDEISLSALKQDLECDVYKEVKLGNLVFDSRIKTKRREKTKTMIHLLDYQNNPRSKQGLMVLEYLSELGTDVAKEDLITDMGVSSSVLDTLKKNSFIETYEVEILKEEDIKEYTDKEVTLNESQMKCYKKMDLLSDKCYLLHGITGSGKTEIYMRWIKDCIDSNKKALMLVPEISLTPQITAQFYARFKENIAVLHSRLSISEKYDEYKRIKNGEVKIVVGARSAIFAPIDNLGIIIIDECHESSYKQTNNPRYNAIDLAKLRSKRYHCPLVLGSATPNVEDYYKAVEGEYELMTLPIRANQMPLPKSYVVDMREELRNNNKTPISNLLKEKIIDCYQKKEQSILFLNRRGYSTFVQCRSCGSVIKCPHCDISLTYHSKTNTLKCHYCGFTRPNVLTCDNCKSDKIRFVGTGTEKIYEAVKKILPEAKVLRVDMDSVSKMEDYEAYYDAFKNKEADILVGTQMITKGLDFENVTLVGVLNADLAMHYPTYDANQVAFNLIEQVSGRAGRSHLTGEVVIQTYDPGHYVIKSSENHDYDTFYKREILLRRASLMPPFSEIIEIDVSGESKIKVHEEALRIVTSLKRESQKSIILGPTEAYLFRINDMYHYTITIQAVEDKVLEAIRYLYPLYQDNKDINVMIKRS